MESSSPNKEEIERFSVSVPKDIYENFEKVRKNVGISRSQAIRNAMHLFTEKESKSNELVSNQEQDKFVLATINILMKHPDWGITHEHSHEPMHHFTAGHDIIDDTDHKDSHSKHFHGEANSSDEDFSQRHSSRYIGVLEADFLHNNEIQHEFHDVIISVTHIHAEHDLCMEILVTKGSMNRIQALYSKLRTLKSVIDIRLFVTISETAN